MIWFGVVGFEDFRAGGLLPGGSWELTKWAYKYLQQGYKVVTLLSLLVALLLGTHEPPSRVSVFLPFRSFALPAGVRHPFGRSHAPKQVRPWFKEAGEGLLQAHIDPKSDLETTLCPSTTRTCALSFERAYPYFRYKVPRIQVSPTSPMKPTSFQKKPQETHK